MGDFEKNQQKSQEQIQKWQEEFGKKSLNQISEKWNKQMVRNKNEFEQGSKELLNYELKLMQQILAIEQVQKQSDTVVEQCRSNIKELDAI